MCDKRLYDDSALQSDLYPGPQTLINSSSLPDNFPHSVWLLMAVVAVVGSNSLALGPIAPDISSDMGESITRVLTASAWFGFGTAISALLLARYIDRSGARFALSYATAVLAISFAACAAATNTTLLSTAQLCAGLASGVALPACYVSAAVVAPANRESKVLGIVLMGWTVSLVLGVSMSALIADVMHWRIVFTLLTLLSATCFVTVLRSTLPNHKSQAIVATPISALKVKRVPYLLFVVACYMTAFYGVYNYVGDHIVQTLGKPVRANAWIAVSYGCGFGLATLLDPLLDRLTARRSTSRIFTLPNLALSALAVLYLLILLVSENYALLIVASGLWGMLNHLGLNILIASLNATDPNKRGAIIGLYSCITYLCLGIGTLVFGYIYTATTFSVLCLCSAGLCTSAVLVGWLKRS